MSKEKEIEEMAKDLKIAHDEQKYLTSDKSIKAIATDLYKAGYRKQSEGEWKKPSRYSEHICTICKKSPCQYFGMLPPFCPNCGAKMKGGEE